MALRLSGLRFPAFPLRQACPMALRLSGLRFPAFPLRRACPMALRLSGLLSPYADPIRVGRIRRSRHPAMPTQCPFTDNGQLPINLKESPIPLAEHQISVAAF